MGGAAGSADGGADNVDGEDAGDDADSPEVEGTSDVASGSTPPAPEPAVQGARENAAVPDVRAMRDATRGGVATILNEIAKAADVGVMVSEDAIPVRPEVRGACELLGIDPMYVACEGRLVAVVPSSGASAAVQALRSHPLGAEAAVIGSVVADQPGIVRLKTSFGGTRIVDMLVGDPLPRIC